MKTQFTFRIVALSLLSLTAVPVSAQSLLWETHAVPNSSHMTDARAMAHDDDGNIAVGGYFYGLGGTVDLDPGAGVSELPSTQNSINAFLAKYTPTGQVIWSRPFRGAGLSHTYGVAVDGSGDIYATGLFWGTMDFNGGPGEYLMTSTNGSEDAFLVKYRGSGEFMWARQFPSSWHSRGQSVTVNNQSDIYVTGTFEGTMDLDPTVGTLELTSNGEQDVFVARYDVLGNVVWAKSFGGPHAEFGSAVTPDVGGTITLTGGFSDTVDFNPDPVAVEEHVSLGGRDAFIVRLDSDANFVFANSVGGVQGDQAISVVSDAGGNSYIGGQFEESLVLDPVAGSPVLTKTPGTFAGGFVVKYDNTGSMLWGKGIQGASSFSLVTDLAFDDIYDRLYISASYFGDGMDADPGTGTALMSHDGDRDFLFGEYTPDGSMIWANGLGGAQEDELLGVMVNTDGSVCIAGFYSLPMDIDPSGVLNTLPAVGNRNLLIASYGSSSLGIATLPENGMALYPNPVSEALTITLSDMPQALVSVADIHGKTVLPSRMLVSGESVEMAGLPAGVYLVRVAAEKGERTARVVKR